MLTCIGFLLLGLGVSLIVLAYLTSKNTTGSRKEKNYFIAGLLVLLFSNIFIWTDTYLSFLELKTALAKFAT